VIQYLAPAAIPMGLQVGVVKFDRQASLGDRQRLYPLPFRPLDSDGQLDGWPGGALVKAPSILPAHFDRGRRWRPPALPLVFQMPPIAGFFYDDRELLKGAPRW